MNPDWGKRLLVRLFGLAIFGFFLLAAMIWPFGNMADNYGGDRGAGNNAVILIAAAIGSVLVYVSQRIRWRDRIDRPSPEIILASLASMIAIQTGVWIGWITGWSGWGGWHGETFSLLFILAGFASIGRALWLDWSRLGTLPRWLCVGSDLYLGAAAGLNLLRFGFSDLGFSKHGAAPEWATALSGWFGLLVFAPLLLALGLVLLPGLKR